MASLATAISLHTQLGGCFGRRRACQRGYSIWRPCAAEADGRPSDGPGAAATAPDVPELGWLWDRKGAAAQTRQRLHEHNLRPKKSLGQNFLLDDDVLARIAAAADLSPADPVLEVGPGTGNLTRHLLAAGAVVTAVEKDDALFERLAASLLGGGADGGGGGGGGGTEGGAEGGVVCGRSGAGVATLVRGDILRQDLPALLAGLVQAAAAARAQLAAVAGAAETPAPAAAATAGGAPAAAAATAAPAPLPKVLANLPYNITKPCLQRMLPLGGAVDRLLFMLQDEVAVRLTATTPGGADWRAMNLLVLYYSRPTYLFRVDRRKYHPPPGVHGAVVDFRLLPPEQRVPVPGEAGFIRLVNKAFSQRRKVLRNSLQPLHSAAEVAAALEAAGLGQEARAQDLSLEQFAALAWALERGRRGGGE